MALIGTLTSGISALKTFSKGLEVIGNNIANVNTTGYKASSMSFADAFSNSVRSASTGPGGSALQVGTGVQMAGVTTKYTQGSLSSTGKGTDLGISGGGYFVVQDAAGKNFATRDGSFHFDPAGNLVNAQDFAVLDSAGAKITLADYATATSITIGSDGSVIAFQPDGTFTTTPQKVGLLKIPDESKLMKQGANLYDFANTGADATTDIGEAGLDGRGGIQAGTLELSNVDLTEQFSELITTQRSFQAGSRLVTLSDSVLEDIVNLKR